MACQPQSGPVNPSQNMAPQNSTSSTPPSGEKKNPAEESSETRKVADEDLSLAQTGTKGDGDKNDGKDDRTDSGAQEPTHHYDSRKLKIVPTIPPQLDSKSNPSDPATSTPPVPDKGKANMQIPLDLSSDRLKTSAQNCPVQVYGTSLPLPKEIFEKQKGKPMCMVDYAAIRKFHLLASDLDKGVMVAEPERLRSYDQLLVKMHPALKAKRKFGTEGRTKIIAQTWKQMLGSMTTSYGTCDLEFRGSGMKLDFMAHGPLARIDQETDNPGTRFMLKSEDYDQPSWSLKCPLKSDSGDIEMRTVKRGNYFFVFVDMYENEKDTSSDHPMQMMKYLLSAH